MSFLEDLGDGISGTAKDVGGKAKEIGTAAKLHGNIKVEELKIKEQYYKLGKAYYAKYLEITEPGLNDIVGTIDKSNAKIRGYQDELKEAKTKE